MKQPLIEFKCVIHKSKVTFCTNRILRKISRTPVSLKSKVPFCRSIINCYSYNAGGTIGSDYAKKLKIVNFLSYDYYSKLDCSLTFRHPTFKALLPVRHKICDKYVLIKDLIAVVCLR